MAPTNAAAQNLVGEDNLATACGIHSESVCCVKFYVGETFSTHIIGTGEGAKICL